VSVETTRRSLATLARIGRTIDELDATLGATAMVAAAAESCRDAMLTLALLGEYNSGKSSLLNLFLGKAVVPVGRFPETGSVCHVRHGLEDAIQTDSAQRVGPTVADLRSTIAITRDGRRTDAALPDRVEIVRTDLDIPDGVIIADTPGVNDDARMTRLAFDAAADADVLIWVFHSRQFLSLEEAAFLRALAGRGAAPLCLFVANTFLEEDSPDEWTARCAEDEPHYRSKLSALVRDLGLEVHAANRAGADEYRPVFVSARAGRRDGETFGGAAFRKTIDGLVTTSREHLLDRRRRRIVHRCTRDLIDAAAPHAQLARAEYERRCSAHAAAAAARAARERYRGAIVQDVAAAIAEFSAAADAAGAALAATVSGATLKRDNTYEQNVDRALRAAAASAAGNLAAQLKKTAGAYGQAAPKPEVKRALRAAFRPPPARIAVPAGGGTADGAAGGAVAGAIAGSVVPVIGTFFGAIAGGLIGLIASDNAATEKAVTRVKDLIGTACSAAAAAIRGRRDHIVDTCMHGEAGTVEESSVQPPDARAMEAWQRVASALAAAEKKGATKGASSRARTTRVRTSRPKSPPRAAPARPRRPRS
jgi:hypothetical protein